MLTTAEIKLWGNRIAIINKEENKPYVSFEYDKDFIKSGIQVSPLLMPLSNRVYEFPDLVGSAFHGVPGLIADSLPDKFGNAVINQWLSLQGKTESDFNVIDRLCYTGTRGMGALEYVPAIEFTKEIDESINITQMVDFASKILNNRKKIKLEMTNDLTYSQLLQLGTSAGGARAKALIAWNTKTSEIRSGQLNLDKDFDYWLIKFDGVNKNGDHNLEDSPEYTLIEYAYYKMATLGGINMNECRIFSENNYNHFLTKRFDRVQGKKLHMQTLGALCHIDYNIPCLCSYEQAANYMKRLGLGANEVEQFYRRMIFNVLAVNQDDHVKNVSFLMDKSGSWHLAPAYDITFSYDISNKWLSAHQMLINGKNKNITIDDLLTAGKNMDISTQKCKHIIEEVKNAVSQWNKISTDIGINKKTIRFIQKMLNF